MRLRAAVSVPIMWSLRSTASSVQLSEPRSREKCVKAFSNFSCRSQHLTLKHLAHSHCPSSFILLCTFVHPWQVWFY
ncbi:hypothetical protein BDR04DRAFT_587160 [Suillus decipiens]|nr:hypothetical protein BDR04DRAFT_587160 [Suillus decipiens]